MKKIIVMFIAAAMVFFLVSCSSNGKEDSAVPEEPDLSGYTIGFCGMTLDNEYHVILTNAVIKACKDAGINYEIHAGSEHSSVDEQKEIINNYIKEGVDGIILVPASSDGLLSSLKACKKANIPVITLDTRLSDETIKAVGEKIPFYGTDNYVGGQLTGEYFAELYPDAGTRVAILRGIEDQANDEDRYSGFLDTAGDISLVAETHCNWETDQAYNAMKSILSSNPGLDAVYCENDLMGLGAFKAIDEAGRNDQIDIFSYDGITAGLEAVVNGDFKTTCAQQPIEMGYFGVENMIKIITGKKAEPYIDTGCRLVTEDNAGKLLETISAYTEDVVETK